VDQAIEDGVGERRIFQIGMPLLHRQLAGDERGATIVAIIQDLQEVASDRIRQRREAEVIYDQQIGLGELSQEGGLALQRRMPEQLVHEARDAEAAHAVIGSTGGVADGARNEALADASGTCQQDVQMLTDPGEVRDLGESGPIDAASGLQIQIFESGRLRELGPAQPLSQSAGLALEAAGHASQA
jgi:hypothetical protein